MLKLLSKLGVKVGEYNITPACDNDNILRDTCAECAQKRRWLPKVTALTQESNSRMFALAKAALDIDDETIKMFCDCCWRFDSEDINDDVGWIDQLECWCLCLVGVRMGFGCEQCIIKPGFGVCSIKRHSVQDCKTNTLRYYDYYVDDQSETLPICTKSSQETYTFETCAEPELYRRFLKALWISKTRLGTGDDLIAATQYLFPNDEVEVIDHGFGKAWITLNRTLSDTERRMRELFRMVLPIPVGVSFRILEPRQL